MKYILGGVNQQFNSSSVYFRKEDFVVISCDTPVCRCVKYTNELKVDAKKLMF